MTVEAVRRQIDENLRRDPTFYTLPLGGTARMQATDGTWFTFVSQDGNVAADAVVRAVDETCGIETTGKLIDVATHAYVFHGGFPA